MAHPLVGLTVRVTAELPTTPPLVVIDVYPPVCGEGAPTLLVYDEAGGLRAGPADAYTVADLSTLAGRVS